MGSSPCPSSQLLMKMCLLVEGLAWHQRCSRHRAGVSACIFTAYIPDGSYSYMTSSASEFLHSLTSPGAPGAQVVYSQVEVRPAEVAAGFLRTGRIGSPEKERNNPCWKQMNVGLTIPISYMRHWWLREVKKLAESRRASKWPSQDSISTPA